MAYGKKQKENKSFILNRIKDYTTLEVGKEYHLRKMLSRDGNVIKDEVHDVVLKEFKDGNFTVVDCNPSFPKLKPMEVNPYYYTAHFSPVGHKIIADIIEPYLQPSH